MKKDKVLLALLSTIFLLALAVALYFLNRSSTETASPELSEQAEKSSAIAVEGKVRVDRGEGEVAQKEADGPLSEDSKLGDENFEQSLAELRSFCFTAYPEYRDTLPEKEEIMSTVSSPQRLRVWANFHLESPRGDVYRVRRFLDDGENLPLERLVFFKEDETGFPEIVDIPQKHQVNPSDEVVRSYLERGELIYSGEAYTVDQDGQSYFFEVENGEIVRFDIASERGVINCQRPRE